MRSERWKKVMKGDVPMYCYSPLLDNRLGHFLWRNLCCGWGWHLWDEVLSGLNEHHSLYCDACGESFIGHDWQEPDYE